MNTKAVLNSKTNHILFLPKLDHVNHNRVLTKHGCNIGLYLSQGQVSLFFWLVYRSGSDNVLTYSTNLLRAYSKSVIEANKLYHAEQSARMPNGISVTLNKVRAVFISLIESGHLLWLPDGKLIINPMLVYYEYLTTKEWNQICDGYSNLRPDGIGSWAKEYVNLVRNKM